MTLRAALGTAALLPQFILYRLDWDAERKKYKKQPCSWDGQRYPVSAPGNMGSYDAACAALDALRIRYPVGRVEGYALGFWLTIDSGLFLLDLDECVVNGALSADATAVIMKFPGALVETSSSGSGMHVIGRRGDLVAHSNRGENHYEFYVRDRGIAFGVGQTGSADVDCTAALNDLLPEYFPARQHGAGTDTRRPDWRGPEDDDELISKFLAARPSAAVALGGKVGLRQLWAGECEQNNRSDMALASHLAFWTGCDGDRIERLMWRSGLVREKWTAHRTYLRKLTINTACADCTTVYQEPERDMSLHREMYGVTTPAGALAPVISTPADLSQRVAQLLVEANAAGTYEEITEQLIPRIAAAGIPEIMIERLVQTINKKLDFFGGKLPVNKLRTLLCPPRLQRDMSEPPLWVQRHCYITKTDTFYNAETGAEISPSGFNAVYSRVMPFKLNGRRESPVEWALERWSMTTVDDIAYRPDMPTYFTYAAREYVNSYVPASIPPLEDYTADVVNLINRFQQHLLLICGGRHDVYTHILNWLAHNVQFPGKKIRWTPLIKGAPGDGKSIVFGVLRAALGARNVRITSTSTLANSGGFTDWGTGFAVNIIEEIHMTGKERHKLFNAMKGFIGDDVIEINRKGRASEGSIVNTCNHGATTNFTDGVPVDDEDRRWLVMFTPYANIGQAAAAHGLQVAEYQPYLGEMGDAMKKAPGQWRRWLMSIDLSSFNPDARAPWTQEKGRMTATASDPMDDFVKDLIAEGGVGIHVEAFSSGNLAKISALKAQFSGVEIPKTSSWSHILARLGYEKYEKPVWWNNSTHRVWAKPGISGDLDQIKGILDQTCKS